MYIVPNHIYIDAPESASELISVHALHRNTNNVTMPICDILLRHFRKLLLYMHRYAVSDSYLFYVLLTIYNYGNEPLQHSHA